MIPANVLAFIVNDADSDDVDRIIEAIRTRQRTLRDQRAAIVQKGQDVTLDHLSPKALNGLKGTVEGIHGKAAAVRLDEESTAQLAWSRTKYGPAARRAEDAHEGYLLNGVPLGCCQVAS